MTAQKYDIFLKLMYFAKKNQSVAKVATIENELLADVEPCGVEQRGIKNRLIVLIKIHDDFSVELESTSAVAASEYEQCERLQLAVVIEDA